MLPLVKVVVDVELTEVRSRDERITPADKVTADFEAIWSSGVVNHSTELRLPETALLKRSSSPKAGKTHAVRRSLR
jgi:hypothetical protein